MQDEFKNRSLKQHDVVSLHTEILENLKKQNPKKYVEVIDLLEGVEPVRDDNYIVLKDEKELAVFLTGRRKGSSSDQDLVRTEKPVPVEYLFYCEPTDEDGLTGSDRKFFGLD